MIKTTLTLLLSAGLLISVAACGKRGDPIPPSQVTIETNGTTTVTN